MDSNEEVVRLPVPQKLEQPITARSLAANVRNYFYALWENASFRSLLASVGNKDSITGNRLFDRHQAVGMIKETAKQARDGLTTNAKDGDIYKQIVHLMSKNGMGLRLRREQYKALTHQAPAE